MHTQAKELASDPDALRPPSAAEPGRPGGRRPPLSVPAPYFLSAVGPAASRSSLRAALRVRMAFMRFRRASSCGRGHRSAHYGTKPIKQTS